MHYRVKLIDAENQVKATAVVNIVSEMPNGRDEAVAMVASVTGVRKYARAEVHPARMV